MRSVLRMYDGLGFDSGPVSDLAPATSHFMRVMMRVFAMLFWSGNVGLSNHREDDVW